MIAAAVVRSEVGRELDNQCELPGAWLSFFVEFMAMNGTEFFASGCITCQTSTLDHD